MLLVLKVTLPFVLGVGDSGDAWTEQIFGENIELNWLGPGSICELTILNILSRSKALSCGLLVN